MIVHEENTTHDETIGDADLILRTRSGDTEAFGELWRRHYPSGLSVARSVTSSIDPDDLVQESYTRIYQAIIKGGGPNGSFRAYLFTSIRNTAAGWGRARRETAIDELDTVADPDTTDQAASEALDRSLTAQAFRSLPSRWQEVLWYTEIEQMKPQEVGPLLGMKAGAVSQLAFRAREGLREAWIQAHLRSAEDGSECQWTIEHLGAYSRGNLSTRDHKRLELHLDECARCMIVAAEAKDVSKRLALVLLPLVLGVTGAAGYLATLQGAGTPIVALAAMPSSIPGAVFAGDPGVTHAATGLAASGGSGSGAGGSASGTAGSSAGAGAGAAGGVFTGIGALVGVGSAALVVAGVVAASTIIPGLAGADPATSLPNAGDEDPSSISADVGPDEKMSLDEPVIIETPVVVPEEAPAPPTDEQAAPGQDPSSAPAVTTPPVTTPPTAPVEPTKPVEPEKPVDPVEPGIPTEAPTWTTATIIFDELTVHYRVPITGAPGATVEALLDGSHGGGDSIVLDDSGAGEIDLRPGLFQYYFAASTKVTFRYVLDTGDAPFAETTLLALQPNRPGIEIPIEEAPVEEDPTESDQTPVEENPVSSAPVDDVVITTDAPAEVAPVDEAPAEVAPAEVAPAEVAPVEVAPVIPAPVEKAPITTRVADVAAPVEAGAVPTEDSPVAE
ncbi:sigma-70 family RNA polymerase sigma factor [Microbacterium maritypicum]|uniref:Sigma-70 family RNA polymerase sigma factor n=1 Tax=Microbacterium maritypicum TaxID=33918 RepID=A0ACD4B992_MICMQ|nr:sigma-70 family RNA polymerase sigma factor [Microbacterium liquefaciens]UTT54057.1 sigma-70 family RNA polymerase sigma factor [Microbacterium liquefaciens]